MNKDDLISDDIKVVKDCLASGVDPNSFVGGDAVGVPALAVQCFLGRADIVRLLISSGADPNQPRASTGETPLHHAITGEADSSDQLSIVSHLLDAGADPNRSCSTGEVSVNFMRDVVVRGETCLHRAAAYSGVSVIETLLSAGACKDVKDANGDSPLSWASLHKREAEILKLLCYGDFRI